MGYDYESDFAEYDWRNEADYTCWSVCDGYGGQASCFHDEQHGGVWADGCGFRKLSGGQSGDFGVELRYYQSEEISFRFQDAGDIYEPKDTTFKQLSPELVEIQLKKKSE